MASKPACPRGLGADGKSLWRSMVADLADDLEFDARELAILAAAARQSDMIAKLERLVAAEGLSVRGSAGQPVLHGGVAELRQSRVALARLLGEIDLDDRAGSMTAAQQRASKAAKARWSRHREQKLAAVEGLGGAG
jgi:hypothetical protein